MVIKFTLFKIVSRLAVAASLALTAISFTGCTVDRVDRVCGTTDHKGPEVPGDGKPRFPNYCQSTCDEAVSNWETDITRIAGALQPSDPAAPGTRDYSNVIAQCRSRIDEYRTSALFSCENRSISLIADTGYFGDNDMQLSTRCNCNSAAKMSEPFTTICPELAELDPNNPFGSFFADINTANQLGSALAGGLGGLGDNRESEDGLLNGSNLGGGPNNQAGATANGNGAVAPERANPLASKLPGGDVGEAGKVGEFIPGSPAGGKGGGASTGQGGFGSSGTTSPAATISGNAEGNAILPSTANAYQGTGGNTGRSPGSVGDSGGAFNWAANRLASLGGGTGNTLNVGPEGSAHRDVNPLGSADPDDYFSRLSPHDSLFKKVELRYRETQVRWAK